MGITENHLPSAAAGAYGPVIPRTVRRQCNRDKRGAPDPGADNPLIECDPVQWLIDTQGMPG